MVLFFCTFSRNSLINGKIPGYFTSLSFLKKIFLMRTFIFCVYWLIANSMTDGKFDRRNTTNNHSHGKRGGAKQTINITYKCRIRPQQASYNIYSSLVPALWYGMYRYVFSQCTTKTNFQADANGQIF